MRPAGRPVFLVGFMGAGKTAVGRALAETMGRVFVDLDAEIERREGRAIGALFQEFGERAFREAESRAFEELGDGLGMVVAAGGGAFTQAAVRRRMKALGVTVWLDVPLEVARERVGAALGRPLWTADDPVALRAQFDRRRATYALAEQRIDAASASPRAIARDLASRVLPENAHGH